MTAIMHQWVVYNKPKDFPQGMVARLWEIHPGKAVPTDTAIHAEHPPEQNAGISEDTKLQSQLEVIRLTIRELNPDMVCIPRRPEDEPQIVEVWT